MRRAVPRTAGDWKAFHDDRNEATDLYALNTTKHGHPNHPLYQPKDAEPEVYEPHE